MASKNLADPQLEHPALAALRNPALLEDPEMQRLASLPVGVQRR